jgi:CDP-glucose 4,6-dehydratase
VIDKDFWHKKRVFITGHTGFKGSWLCLWLHALGAEITGYALTPPTQPNLFELAQVDKLVQSILADIRDGDCLTKRMLEACPEIVIHLAAQPLVRDSYKDPVYTYSTNVMGTVNLFEAVRKCKNVKAVINVTTDKCYENREWLWGYRENEPMGGYDPYSNSKACSELVTSSYRNSFFNPREYDRHGVALASARSGNVIGGGDWAADRLVPDCVRAILKGEKVIIRNPQAIRPWQHVLEPLWGYLILAQKLWENGPHYAEAWNFGPDDQDAKTVEWVIKRICAKWGEKVSYQINKGSYPHEAHYLKLDCTKAKSELTWYPKWNLEQAIDKVIEWIQAYRGGKDVNRVCRQQIREYEKTGEGTEREITEMSQGF